ncbi:MAG TPA: TetR/AcrR family transcriptional regulator [Gammaproteobacteria bacterium]|jgi:AcrR family transcriptional regulator|nr:TetR/AcrR family transcriptional regulator [Gammaproteobacteria bacterium]HET7588033.1 TetR/AcrR family transcriptional regulator [Gammaproteobacteria bacterium]
MVPDAAISNTSRARLIEAGRTLMAEMGYEGAATAAIARRAATSESQLMRYFGGKAGLLEAIFDEGWTQLNGQIETVIEGAPNVPAALVELLSLFIAVFDRDQQLARLFLFEGRRPRGPRAEIRLSRGYVAFIERIAELVVRGQRGGSLSTAFDPRMLVAAMFGAAEAMVRDRLMNQRREGAGIDSAADLRQVFEAMIKGFAAPG